MHLNDLFTLFGARLVRNSTFARFRALEAELQNCKRASNLVSCDPSGLVRIILNEIASNQIDASSALGAIFKDINVAGQLVAATEAAAWLHQYADKVPGFARRPELLESIIPRIPADGDLAEFGVFKGAVTRFMRPRFPSRIYHAFDSFHGVPEAMSLSVHQNAFDLGGNIPDLPPGTTVHAGWFEDTIPRWREHFDAPIAWAYIDCDLYESVCAVLEGLTDRIRPGTILSYDDWYNFPNWQQHSLKATREWTDRTGIKLTPIAYTTREHSVTFVVD
jgi:hypothetical protein